MAKWNANICRIHEKHIRTYSTYKKEIHVHVYINHQRYDFRIKTMFGSSIPTVVCRRAHVLFTFFVLICL